MIQLQVLLYLFHNNLLYEYIQNLYEHIVYNNFNVVKETAELNQDRIKYNKRESKNRKYLGKEVLLIGSLTGFVSQAVIGLFLFNRTVNGMALLTFMFLGSLVLAHTVTIRRDSNEAVSR